MGHQQRFVGTKSGYPMVSQNTVVSYHDYVGVFMAIPVMWLNPTINLQFGDDTPIYGDFGHDLFFFWFTTLPHITPPFSNAANTVAFLFPQLESTATRAPGLFHASAGAPALDDTSCEWLRIVSARKPQCHPLYWFLYVSMILPRGIWSH